MPAARSSPATGLPRAWRMRLRAVYRSAGWPYQDPLEVELLAAGLLERTYPAHPGGAECVRLSDQGVAALAAATDAHRQSRDEHERIVRQVARAMQRDGRIVWRGLSLRAWVEADAPPAAVPPPDIQPTLAGIESAQAPSPASGHWRIARPDVYSIRHTTAAAYLHPVAHEVKARRADLLSDLRQASKAESYHWLAGQCWYVLREGIAEPEEIPERYGVLLAGEDGRLLTLRHASARAMELPFAVWMALAKAAPEPPLDDDALALGP